MAVEDASLICWNSRPCSDLGVFPGWDGIGFRQEKGIDWFVEEMRPMGAEALHRPDGADGDGGMPGFVAFQNLSDAFVLKVAGSVCAKRFGVHTVI